MDIQAKGIGSAEVTWLKGKCTCYVQELPPVVQFGLHFGAHNVGCPVYRVSGDIVDKQKDIEFREAHEGSLLPCVHCARAQAEVDAPE
jgi:hypothetical protein